MQIFISYSSKDNIEAFKLCEFLEQKGNQCFIAPRNIQPGREYGEEIINGIDSSEGMILLLSENSNQSPHVLREVERAVSKKIPIYVYSLEQVALSKSMEYFLMTHQWGSLDKEDIYFEILEWVNGLEKGESTKQSTQQKSKVTKTQKKQKKAFGIKLAGVIGGLLLILLVCVGMFLFNGQKIAEVAQGDTIVLGTYNGEPIEWRVLKIEEEQAILVAKNILTMKAYDAAEGGKYNYDGNVDYWMEPLDGDWQMQVKVRGNSDWSASNIRIWLNSDKEVVSYSDQKPNDRAMSELKNGYDNEPGFLNGFTQEELAAIVESEVITDGNVLANEECITTKDRVYLLSVEELKWFEEAGISLFAVPTQAAVEQDESGWYLIEKDGYGVETYYWWLREPVEETASMCYMVGNGYWDQTTMQGNAGAEGYGIRPAITVDLKADYLVDLYGADS